MPKKKKKEEKAASPRTEAAQESKVTLQNIVDGINRINKYFDGAAQEVLS